jgi:hypothetical protein
MISSSLGEHSRKGTPVRVGKQESEVEGAKEVRKREAKIATESQSAQRSEKK